jgi:glycosyltransferase involved in cell wall biosynthesis
VEEKTISARGPGRVRVLQVTSLERGGPLEAALTLSAALVAGGVEVEAVCATEPIAARFAAAGATPHLLPLRSPTDVAAGRRLRALGADVDVVHAQDRRSGLWTRIWPRRRHQVLVYTVHGLPDPYLPPPAGDPAAVSLRDRLAYRGLDALLARRSDVVISPSRFLAGELVRTLGYPARRIEVVPNGIEVGAPPPPGNLIATISVLEPVKDIDTFLRAGARVYERRPDSRFAIFGDGSERSRLERAAAAGPLGSSIEFRGHRPAAEAIGSTAILALPSLLENAPMALLEAMAAARPAVATAVGGIPEIAGEVVPLIAPGDDEALAARLLELLDDPARAAAAGARGRERVLAHFTAADCAERTRELYAAALEGRR